MNECLKCGKELSHIEGRRKKKFCNETCRSLYWYYKNKVVKMEQPKAPKPIVQKITNGAINTNIPPMPVRMDGEDTFDFAARKNEWKKLYNQ